MKKRMNKRGISVIIGYVLLVVAAIVISGVVYAWLKSYIPKDVPSCPDGVSVSVVDSSCVNGELVMQIKNNGRFSINGYYVRAALKPNQEIATTNLLGEEYVSFPSGLGAGETDTVKVFNFNSEKCDGTCSEGDICFGGNVCEGLDETQCNDANTNGYDCDWVGSGENGNCVGTATCSEVSDCLEFDSCSGPNNVQYYQIYSVEVIPLANVKDGIKDRVVSCGDARIKENFKECLIYGNL